jgi:hypothetical protein
LKQNFKIVERPATYYLGLEIDKRQDGKIKISQEAYARRILERFNFSNCNPVSTPMVWNRGKKMMKLRRNFHIFKP